jgi:hypothetical protein
MLFPREHKKQDLFLLNMFKATRHSDQMDLATEQIFHCPMSWLLLLMLQIIASLRNTMARIGRCHIELLKDP